MKITEIKQLLEVFATACYIKGKVEGLQGMEENNAEKICKIPENIWTEIMTDIDIEEKIEEEGTIMGFHIAPKEMQEKKTPTIITEAKEKELIKKFGKKKMEKLAKEIKFKGKILNNKEKIHAKN
jgi:hypothetical protein